MADRGSHESLAANGPAQRSAVSRGARAAPGLPRPATSTCSAEELESTGTAQDLMTTRFVPAIYER